MKKQIFLVLLITNAMIQCMEQTINNHDILAYITHHLCASYGYYPYKIKPDIASLSLTNKTLCNYYAQEKTQQTIIRMITNNLYESDQCIAKIIKTLDQELCKNLISHFSSRSIPNDHNIASLLNCKKIVQKIETFHENVKLQDHPLTPEQLTDHWYLTSTMTSCKQTILISALYRANLNRIDELINAGVSANGAHNGESPLHLIGSVRKALKHRPQHLLDIATLLLEKGAQPDKRTSITNKTPLMRAISNGDKEYAQLLLTYGANPKKIVTTDINDIAEYSMDVVAERTPDVPLRNNAFSFDTNNWLQDMIDKINAEKESLQRINNSDLSYL